MTCDGPIHWSFTSPGHGNPMQRVREKERERERKNNTPVDKRMGFLFPRNLNVGGRRGREGESC